MTDKQFPLWLVPIRGKRNREDILAAVNTLRRLHREGLLGGAVMPEDARPGLPADSAENYHYFSLTMALNYQRDSYVLWRNATQAYNDPETRYIFAPKQAVRVDEAYLRQSLMKYKVAIQPTKHTEIWQTICRTLCSCFDGDIRNLFSQYDWHIPDILKYVQSTNKRGFPYLSGPKICNYWLYVMGQYTHGRFTGRDALNVAPDTHVIQASIRLGLIGEEKQGAANIQELVSKAWEELLSGTGILPIDIHTPLWLWSRGGFVPSDV